MIKEADMQGQGRAPDWQAPTGPPPSYGPPGPGSAPPPAKKPSPLVWAVVGLAAVFFVGATGFMLIKSGGGLDGPVKAEQCVDTGFGMDAGNRIPASLRVDCDDSGAKATVLKITDEGEASGLTITSRAEPDCPEGTDGVTNVRGEATDEKYYEACVRNLQGPHPGDPGAGGAFLSVGDCVSSGAIGFGKEQACSKPNWYGKIIARVGAESSCPARTLEIMKMRSFGGGDLARPVLCLGPGGGVLATGDCVADPSFKIGGPGKADCGSGEAIAKVVGRVRTQQECPDGATHYMTSENAYLPVLCLKKLRPTLDEKLRSLPG
ncbi:LppU/SCO3897 family protein [Actinomadura monticuli]|uniref:Septum formation-related domain-containing protein n=1 Tax=Actinomadura monticuli TaxID=3097367 RepID=A0ABV4Q9A7_9ACTN